MANLSLTRVNQKLSQAKVLLNNVNVETLSQIHMNSLLEAASFHLVCAYRHYLRELAETYGLHNVLVLNTENDLIQAFVYAKKYPAEAEELVALRRDSASWLAQLHVYYDSLWQVPTPITAVSEGELITLVDIEAVARPVVDLALVEHWQQAFMALVRRQRETSAEF